jgi:energy-coupling factor transporter transmembrane protein EcfT
MTYNHLIIVSQIIFSVFILWLGGYDFSSRGPSTVLFFLIVMFINACVYAFIFIGFDNSKTNINDKIFEKEK